MLCNMKAPHFEGLFLLYDKSLNEQFAIVF